MRKLLFYDPDHAIKYDDGFDEDEEKPEGYDDDRAADMAFNAETWGDDARM